MLIVNPEKKRILDTAKVTKDVAPFVAYNGQVIRRIIIKKLDVFGPTINDTSRLPRSWLEKTGNKLHTKSKTYLIRNNLLFHEGQSLNPLTIADNERLLRNLPYIEDATIQIHPTDGSKDSVDVIVITKDVWSKAFDIAIDDVHSGKAKFWDRNVLGIGHEIENDLLWKSNEKLETGYNGNYTINNINKSFIKATFAYYHGFRTESEGVNISRTFFTPDIKYAGGISMIRNSSIINFNNDTIPLEYNTFDTWLGRSFQVNNHKNFTKVRQNITITARLIRNRFYEGPQVSPNLNYNFQNRLIFLTSLSYSRQNYFKSNLIYNFGRTEDIPIGGMANLILGSENNQFYYRRVYAAFSVSTGVFIPHVGYINSSFAAGSFFNPDGHPEQSVISSGINYFSPLLTFNKFRLRQFFNIQFMNGSNRFSNEYLTINKNNGIYGYSNDSVRGTVRFNTHWESVCFSPLYFYGFRLVFFAYADHSWLTNNLSTLFHKAPYTGLGFGIRIRNERLVFNTIQFRFSFFPYLPAGSKTNFLNISGESVLVPPSFASKPADLIPFN